MAYLDHIRRCNSYDPDRFRPFLIAGEAVGAVRHDVAERMRGLAPELIVTAEAVRLDDRLGDAAARGAALDALHPRLVEAGLAPPPKGERYAIRRRWSAPALGYLDRRLAALFGVTAYGVHLNGLVRTADGPALWIGRRAPDKEVAPDKLDNMVAGGQPHDLSLIDNLVKECAEEADLPESLARRARPVGALNYAMAVEEGGSRPGGLRRDVLFCYDLEVPADIVPRNTDGELVGFTLMPVAEVAARVRDTDDFKFNVNLVLIDFLIRLGHLSPDDEPDYEALVAGLRRA